MSAPSDRLEESLECDRDTCPLSCATAGCLMENVGYFWCARCGEHHRPPECTDEHHLD